MLAPPRVCATEVAVLAMTRLGATWDELFPDEQHPLINLVIERIDLVDGGLKITWRDGLAGSVRRIRAKYHPRPVGAREAVA